LNGSQEPVLGISLILRTGCWLRQWIFPKITAVKSILSPC